MSTELLEVLKNAQAHRRKAQEQKGGICPKCKEPTQKAYYCATCKMQWLGVKDGHRTSGLRFKAGDTIHATLHPVIKILDEQQGLVEYVASDETLDSYREVVRADGWRFDHLKKNGPFVDSHDTSTIKNLIGSIVDFKVQGRQLIETVKWAIDVPDCPLARMGFNMTKAGYLKAVSVGFTPIRYATKWDSDSRAWQAALKDLNMHEEDGITVVYLEQQQKELSACILGANPNALARSLEVISKAHKANVLSDADLTILCSEYGKRNTANTTDGPDAVELARHRRRKRFMQSFENVIKKL